MVSVRGFEPRISWLRTRRVCQITPYGQLFLVIWGGIPVSIRYFLRHRQACRAATPMPPPEGYITLVIFSCQTAQQVRAPPERRQHHLAVPTKSGKPTRTRTWITTLGKWRTIPYAMGSQLTASNRRDVLRM